MILSVWLNEIKMIWEYCAFTYAAYLFIFATLVLLVFQPLKDIEGHDSFISFSFREIISE